MRKLLAACAVATAALAAGPVSGASADETFFGKCTVTGIATFTTPLMAPPPTANDYSFVSGKPKPSENDKTLCTGNLNGITMTNQPASVNVGGKAELSCAQGRSTEDGDGALTFKFPVPQTLKLKLNFVAFGTEVALDITGEKSGNAAGHASFANYVDPATAVEKCNQGGGGLNNLGFAGDFESPEQSPLVGSSSAPTGGGNTGGGNTGGGGTGTGGSGTGTGTGGGGGTGTGTTPAPVASTVSLGTVGQNLVTALRRGIPVTLRGNVPAKATLQAQLDAATARRYGLAKSSATRKKPVTIGKGTINLTRAGRTTGYVKLSAVAKRKLRRARKVKVKLVGTLLDVTQRRQRVSRTVTLKR